ncbi:VOC family protein [Spirochaeta dissipatitropha]
MKLGYVIVYVEDVPAATRFYEAAFGLETRFMHESNMYAEMETGSTALAFAHNDMLKEGTGISASKEIKNCFEIAFTTDSVDTDFRKAVSAGATMLSEPVEKPWGQTVSYVQDPFGTIIEICSPIG